MEGIVIISIVGITLPITREPDRVCWVVESPVAQHFGVNAGLHTPEHEFDELPIELWADRPLGMGCIDYDASAALARLRQSSTCTTENEESAERENAVQSVSPARGDSTAPWFPAY
jgi:hypothetical protein